MEFKATDDRPQPGRAAAARLPVEHLPKQLVVALLKLRKPPPAFFFKKARPDISCPYSLGVNPDLFSVHKLQHN